MNTAVEGGGKRGTNDYGTGEDYKKKEHEKGTGAKKNRVPKSEIAGREDSAGFHIAN